MKKFCKIRKNKKAVLGLTLLAVILGVCLVCFIGFKLNIVRESDADASQFHKLGAGFTKVLVEDEASAIAAAQDAARILGLGNAADELVLKNASPVDDTVYYRLNQNYCGIPVYGRTMVVVTDDIGNVEAFTSNGMDIQLSGDLEPAAAYDDVQKTVSNFLKKKYDAASVEITAEDQDSMVIYTFSDNKAVLAYDLIADIDGGLYEVIVDADSAEVLSCITMSLTQTVQGSGLNNDNQKVTFNANCISEGKYTLEDLERNIRVYNANNKITSGEVRFVDSEGNYYYRSENEKEGTWISDKNTAVNIFGNLRSPCRIETKDGTVLEENAYILIYLEAEGEKMTVLQSDSAEFEDSDAVTLMSGVQTTYDFFKNCFNRIGFDNKNGSLEVVYNTETITAHHEYGDRDFPATLLTFNSKNPETNLSIATIAHEYMHGVEGAISGMIYENNSESGAIKEAYSDLFGEIVEDYADGQLDGSCDWVHKAVSESLGNESRSLSNPRDTGNPSKVSILANRETHIYSTVVSHAAYLMANGSLNGVNLSINELASLWYRTLFVLPSNCTFVVLREYMELTADILGFSEEQMECISAAFDEVGIRKQEDGKETYSVKSQLLYVYDRNGKVYEDCTVQIKKQGLFGGKKVDYNDEKQGPDQEYIELNLQKGDYTITVTDNKDESLVVQKNIKVRPESTVQDILIATNFGEKTTESNLTIEGNYGSMAEEEEELYITYEEMAPITMYVILYCDIYTDVNATEGILEIEDSIEAGEAVIVDGKGTFDGSTFYRIYRPDDSVSPCSIIPAKILSLEKPVEAGNEAASGEEDKSSWFNGEGYVAEAKEYEQKYISYEDMEPVSMYAIRYSEVYPDLNASEGVLRVDGCVFVGDKVTIDGKGTYEGVEYYRIKRSENSFNPYSSILPADALSLEKPVQ